MNNGQTERTAVYVVSEYLNRNNKFAPKIDDDGNTPIVDGYFTIYKNGQQKVEDFFAQIPVQVKGTATDKEYYYRIGREHVDAYKQLGGIVFFKVVVDQDCKKILYTILSTNKIDGLLTQSTKQIKIVLEEVPEDHEAFESEILAFASMRNGEKVETSSPKEIADLAKEFEKMRGRLGEIKDHEVKYELESLLDSIKNTNSDDTFGWRDKFIFYSRKALDLAIKYFKDPYFAELLYHFGEYLYGQKEYQFVEKYYKIALDLLLSQFELISQSETETNIVCMEDCPYILNSLANLHSKLERYEESKVEYEAALKGFETLYKECPNNYKREIAMVLNNLANLNSNVPFPIKAKWNYQKSIEINEKIKKIMSARESKSFNNDYWEDLRPSFDETDEEGQYKKALQLYKELEQDNPGKYKGDIAMILNNLGNLYTKELDDKKKEKAEDYLNEALKIYRELAATNHDSYIENVAMTLYNLGYLHHNLNNKDSAINEYKESIKLYKELAKSNHSKYDEEEANVRILLAVLYDGMDKSEDAELEANEVLIIYERLAKDEETDKTFNEYVVKAKMILASIHMQHMQYEKAEKEFDNIIMIFINSNSEKYKYYNLLAQVFTSQALVCTALNKSDKAKIVNKKAMLIQSTLLKNELEDFKLGLDYSNKMRESLIKSFQGYSEKNETSSILSRSIDWINNKLRQK